MNGSLRKNGKIQNITTRYISIICGGLKVYKKWWSWHELVVNVFVTNNAEQKRIVSVYGTIS